MAVSQACLRSEMGVNMKVSIISFTKNGGKLNETICEGLRDQGMAAEGYTSGKYVSGTDLQAFSGLGELVGQLFHTADGILFIGACGIAVRAIAPFLKGKTEDPAVLVAGEDGKYVISLLSGHIGGANELSRCIASITGGIPVITTATDINHTFAVDTWAVKNKLIITDLSMIREISGTVLNKKEVGFYCEYPIEGNLPPELAADGITDIGICISDSVFRKPFTRTLNLVPRNLVLGIGCRKGTEAGVIKNMVMDIFDRYNLEVRRIGRICSIDIKGKEEGILELSEVLQAEYVTFSAEELEKVSGEFGSSEFVRKTVGVDNVCERSAALGSAYGKKLIPKTAFSGVTLAAYEMEYRVSFQNAPGLI